MPFGGGYAWCLMRRHQVMPDPGGCYRRCLSRRHQVMPIACRSNVVWQWLEAWRYGTSSTSSFSSSGIRLAKSRQLYKWWWYKWLRYWACTLKWKHTLSTHACVVPLLKVVARSFALGMKIPRLTYDWTRHYRRTYDDSFLKVCLGVMYFLVISAL
jgi:hypothetical protein